MTSRKTRGQVLKYISDNEGLITNNTQMGDALGVTNVAIFKHIDMLENAKMIKVVHINRHARQYYLTDLGRKQMELDK